MNKSRAAIKGFRPDDNVKRTSLMDSFPVVLPGDKEYQTVVIDGEEEVVQIDSVRGPATVHMDGRTDYKVWNPNSGGGTGAHGDREWIKNWPDMSMTEQRVHLLQVAKQNRLTRANPRFQTPESIIGLDNFLRKLM